MNFYPFDSPNAASGLPDEASLRVAFAGNRIDRQAETRSDDAAARALATPGVRIMLFGEGHVALRLDASGVFNAYHSRSEAAVLDARLEEAVLLGTEDDGPIVAAPLGLNPDSLPADIKAIDYRSVYVQGLLDQTALGALAQGAALIAWNVNHRYCGRCGAGTETRAGGYKRTCPSCGREHFPRTDPVVIMLALRGDQCLLGRSPHFAPGMISCLAGFVEPGETIEAAVRREVLEESAIEIGRVAYHASQPWPFPYSLMIGCYAQARSEAIRFDERELEDCRWFSRDEVRRMLEGEHQGGLMVPPKGAIANILIRDWALGER